MQSCTFYSDRFNKSFPGCADGALLSKYKNLLTQLFPEHGVFMVLLCENDDIFTDLLFADYRFEHPGILLHLLTNGPNILFTHSLEQKPYQGIFCTYTELSARFFVCAALKSADGRLLGGIGVLGKQHRSLLPDDKVFMQWLAENLAQDLTQNNTTKALPAPTSLQHDTFPGLIIPYLDDIYLMVDQDGVIISMAEQVPAALKEAISQQGSLLSRLFGADNADVFNDLISLAALTRKKQTHILCLPHVNPDLLFSVSCNRFSDGWYLITFHDVTERHRLRKMLESRKQLLEGIVRAANIGILLLNSDGEILYLNDIAAAWLSLDINSKKIKLPPQYWCYGQDAVDSLSPFQSIFWQKQDLKDQRYDCRVVSGDLKVFSLNATYEAEETGKAAQATFFIQDVTKRSALEQAMRDMDQQMQYLLHSSPVVIYQMVSLPLSHIPSQVTYITPNVEAILGVSSQHLSDGSVDLQSLTHNEDKEYRKSEMGRCHDSISVYRLWVEPQGMYRWFKDVRRYEADEIHDTWIGALLDITELKNSQEMHELLSCVASQTTNSVIITDIEGNTTWVNEGFSRLTGYTASEIIGYKPGDILQGAETDPQTVAAMHHALEKRTGFNVDIVNYDKSHTPYWIRIACNPIESKNGDIKGFIAIQSNIDDEMRSKLLLQEATDRAVKQRNLIAELSNLEADPNSGLDEKLTVIVNKLAKNLQVDRLGIWMLSEDGAKLISHILYQEGSVIDAGFDVLNICDHPSYFNALAKHSQIDVVDARTDPRTREMYDNYLAPINIYSLLDTAILQDGRLIGVLCLDLKDTIREWHHDEKTFLSAIANLVAQIIANDTRRKALKKLESMQLQLEATLNSLVDAVITIDSKGTMIAMNPATYHMFGYSDNALIGCNVSVLMPAAIARQHDNYINNYIKTNDAKIIGIGREVTALHANGHEFPVALSIAAVGEGDNKTFVGCCHDLSLIKKQQQQLLHTEKLSAIGKLTSSLAHDFNNILGIVRGYAEMLQQESEHIAKLAMPIITASDRASAIISELLDFSSAKKRAVSTIQLNQHLVALQPLIEKTLAPGMKLHYQLAEQDTTVDVELPGFDNALINIAINACHAMHGQIGGTLKVATYPYTALDEAKQRNISYVCLEISDNGCGMSEEVRRKIFEPFFTTKGEKGTGLGLAQTYGMVKRCQGHIDVESVAGLGSCFKICLPQAAASVAGDISLAADLSQQNEAFKGDVSVKQKRKTDKPLFKAVILLVDDEPELLDMNALLLESAGYQVFKAANAAEAIKLAASAPIDLLLSDIVMPDTNGFELAKYIKDNYPVARVQLMSGFADTTMVTNDQYKQWYEQRLTKPVSLKELLKRVNDVLF